MACCGGHPSQLPLLCLWVPAMGTLPCDLAVLWSASRSLAILSGSSLPPESGCREYLLIPWCTWGLCYIYHYLGACSVLPHYLEWGLCVAEVWGTVAAHVALPIPPQQPCCCCYVLACSKATSCWVQGSVGRRYGSFWPSEEMATCGPLMPVLAGTEFLLNPRVTSSQNCICWLVSVGHRYLWTSSLLGLAIPLQLCS